VIEMKLPAILLLATTALLPAHPDAAHSLTELNRHIRESPDDPILHLQRAELLLRRNHPETARPSVEKALLLTPDDPSVLLLNAKLLRATGSISEAILRAKEITSRFPDHTPAWDLLAALLHDDGKYDEAIAAKLRHLEHRDHIDPSDYLTAASWIRQRNQPGDPGLTLTVINQAADQFGTLTAIQEMAIRIECDLARYDDALKRVRILVMKYQPSAAFSLLRADILEAAGRHAEAAGACDSAIALLDAQPKESQGNLSGHRSSIQERKEQNLRTALNSR